MADEVEELRRRLDAQQVVIERLEQALTQLQGGRSMADTGDSVAGLPDGGGTRAEAHASSDPASAPDRRQLLQRAAAATAGAVAGGTAMVLGSASPAAAAAGTFDGNPAVTATNTGGSAGKAIQATGGTGNALAAATTGSASTILATASSGNAVDATSATTVLGNAAIKATYTGSSTGCGAANLNGGGGSALRAVNNSSAATFILGNNSTGLLAGAGIFVSSASDTVSTQSSSTNQSQAGVHSEGFQEASGVVGIAFDRGVGGRFSGGRCDAHLGDQEFLAKAPSARNHTNGHAVGELALDAATGNLFMCVVAAPAGQVGTWRKITGPATAGALHVLPTPVRVYDSRPGNPPVAVGPKTPLAAATPRTCDLKANSSGVPAGATAVLVNLVATGTTGVAGGFLSIYRNGIAWPGTSSLNWSGPGQNVAVTTLTAVDASAVCNLFANVVTDVVVDVLGFYL